MNNKAPKNVPSLFLPKSQPRHNILHTCTIMHFAQHITQPLTFDETHKRGHQRLIILYVTKPAATRQHRIAPIQRTAPIRVRASRDSAHPSSTRLTRRLMRVQVQRGEYTAAARITKVRSNTYTLYSDTALTCGPSQSLIYIAKTCFEHYLRLIGASRTCSPKRKLV